MPRKRKSNKDPIVEIVQLDGQDYAVATANDASMIAVEWINDDAHVSAHLHVNTNETRLKKTYNITSNQQYTTIHSHLQTFPLVQRDCHRAKTLHQGHCTASGPVPGYKIIVCGRLETDTDNSFMCLGEVKPVTDTAYSYYSTEIDPNGKKIHKWRFEMCDMPNPSVHQFLYSLLD